MNGLKRELLLGTLATLCVWLSCVQNVASYGIYTVDDPHVCNRSIFLEQGANSAAILKLTSKPSYSTSPLYCMISFKVPIHTWSGLTGILEQVDLRRYQDNGHHLGQPVCVDYITVKTEKQNLIPNERQCGTWSITPGQPISRLGYNKAIVGSCPHADILGNEKCHVTEIHVIVSIGRDKDSALWRNFTWPPHKGFTFVVTAYSYPIKNGESECRDGLRSCSQADSLGARLGAHHCVHNSLWCDGHVNCGLMENMDELSCSKRGVWNGLMTVVVGPWMGASIFLLLVFCGILYYRSSKDRLTADAQQCSASQDINSYAESYELSSNLSSAHHMAIQVRVVCNSNHPHHGSRGGHQPWKNDLPPSYETLFPQGPPQTYSPITSITATVSQASGSTVNAVGINVSSTMSLPSTVASTSGIRNISTSSVASSDISKATTDITSIIDLNIRSNNLQAGVVSGQPDDTNNSSTLRMAADSSILSTTDVNQSDNNMHPNSVTKSDDSTDIQATSSSVTAANIQTNVTLTLTPNHNIGRNECVGTQTGDQTPVSEEQKCILEQHSALVGKSNVAKPNLHQSSEEVCNVPEVNQEINAHITSEKDENSSDR